MKYTKKKTKKICRFCDCPFSPDPRCGIRQYACSNEICQKIRKRENGNHWLKDHPKYKEHKKKYDKGWRKRNPNHSKEYRKSHPDYRQREIERMRLKRLHKKFVAKPN